MPLSSDPYTVLVGTLQGDPIEEVPAGNLQISFLLNQPGSCTFTLPLFHAKATPGLLAPGQRSILVYREGVLFWGGYLWGIDGTNEGLRVFSEGWLSRLRKRLITEDVTYTAIDQLTIAWNLVNYAQTKAAEYALGFQQGNTNISNVNRTVSYLANERAIVLDLLVELAGMANGFDFEITPDRKFNTYYPYKGLSAGAVFELGKNVSSISWQVDASSITNHLTGFGSGSNDDPLLFVIEDIPSQTTYGPLEDIITYTDVVAPAILQALTAGALNVMKVIRDDPQVSVARDDPSIASYSVGDIARIVADYGYIQIDTYKRINSLVFQVSNSGQEITTVTFGEVPIT